MSLSPPTCMRGHAMKVRRYKNGDVWVCAEGCDFTIQTKSGDYGDTEISPEERLSEERLSEERTCACGCDETFTPSPRHAYQRYKDTTHRMRAYRRRRKKERTAKAVENPWEGSDDPDREDQEMGDVDR